jgi:hypothetical protein
MNFVIFHVGLPFIDETCWQLVRYPNLYAPIAATINFVVRSLRQFVECIGKLNFWCGEDKIIYGPETPYGTRNGPSTPSGTSRSRRTSWKATATRNSRRRRNARSWTKAS